MQSMNNFPKEANTHRIIYFDVSLCQLFGPTLINHICMMPEDHALRSNARVYVTSMPHVNSRVRSRATVEFAAATMNRKTNRR